MKTKIDAKIRNILKNKLHFRIVDIDHNYNDYIYMLSNHLTLHITYFNDKYYVLLWLVDINDAEEEDHVKLCDCILDNVDQELEWVIVNALSKSRNIIIDAIKQCQDMSNELLLIECILSKYYD